MSFKRLYLCTFFLGKHFEKCSTLGFNNHNFLFTCDVYIYISKRCDVRIADLKNDYLIDLQMQLPYSLCNHAVTLSGEKN